MREPIKTWEHPDHPEVKAEVFDGEFILWLTLPKDPLNSPTLPLDIGDVRWLGKVLAEAEDVLDRMG